MQSGTPVTLYLCLQSELSEKDKQLIELQHIITELQADVHAAAQSANAANTSSASYHKQVALLDDVSAALEHVVSVLNDRLAVLNSSLEHLLGDSMLAAGLAVYGGMLDVEGQAALVFDWQRILQQGLLAHTAEFSLLSFMAASRREHALLPRGAILDAGLQTSVYLASLVRSLAYHGASRPEVPRRICWLVRCCSTA
jgi:hypothetical protein